MLTTHKRDIYLTSSIYPCVHFPVCGLNACTCLIKQTIRTEKKMCAFSQLVCAFTLFTQQMSIHLKRIWIHGWVLNEYSITYSSPSIFNQKWQKSNRRATFLDTSCTETDVNEMPFGSGYVKRSAVIFFYLMLPMIIMGFKSSCSS